MRRIFIAITTLLLTISSTLSYAQKTRTYDVTSGLSANAIKGIIQDKNGYLWFATTDGLNVFNGAEFKSYGCSYRENGEDEISALSLMTVCMHKDGKQIWSGTQSSQLHLFNPETESFRTISLSHNTPGLDSPNLCYSLSYDKDGKLWIGTDNGLYIYDESKEELSCLSTYNSNLSSNSIHSIFCDSHGTTWVGTTKGLLKYNHVTESFTKVKVDSQSFRGSKDIHITTITEGHSDDLWIGTWNKGFAKYEERNNTLRAIRPSGDNEYAEHMRVRSILHDNGDMFWICSNYGLFKYDVSQNKISLVVLSPNQPNDNIYSSLKDHEGGIWIGTFFQGLHYLSPIARQFECYTSLNTNGKLNGTAISCFCEDQNGHIYIGSENGGLSLFNPAEEKFIDTRISLLGNNIHDLCADEKFLYAGTFSHGLEIINLKNGHIKSITTKTHKTMPSNNVFSILDGEDNLIYLGFDRGCATYNKTNGQISVIDKLAGEFVYDIKEDRHGYIWYATYYNGLLKYNKDEDSWTHYTHDQNDPKSLTHNKTFHLYIDDHEQLWICTEGGGVCRYDYENDCFHKLNLKNDGSDVSLTLINGIMNDSKGNLWISSNNGLWVCKSDGTVVKHFTLEDGLQSNQYNYGAVFRDASGKMYFGGVYGFNIINPEKIKDNKTYPTVTARISYEDKSRHTVTSRTIFTNGEVTIPRNISSFIVDFECLSYTAPHKNLYAYKIDEISGWVYTSEPSVSFINFPHGNFTMYVKAKNGDGIWSEKVVSIEINNLPPFYKSFAAQILFIIAISAIFMIIIVLIIKRHDEKSKIRLNEAKIDFFTHVAHEIKTPVTLIKGPLDVTLRNTPEGEGKHNLEIMSKNTDRLLDLVNQLLDFKKISNDGHQIRMRNSDPKNIVHSMANHFKDSLLGKLDIVTDLTEKPLKCILDPEAYTKIVSNLLSNAFKHAKSKIEVKLDVVNEGKGNILHLEVSDDGCGIPEEEQKKIFESFYQISATDNTRMSGVGIGLSLVKLLVQKHNGKVYVDEKYKNGCRICVDIPYIISDAPEVELVEKSSNNNDPLTTPAASGVNILIVEDTADMLDFISGVFKGDYNIYKAENGKVAIELLYRTEIDIIISDISMPVMNGFELLQEVRRNDMFCHIPMIMLTVESALENKIKGLEYGADAYLEKPFSPTHLKATADNLINRRDTMLRRYTGSPLKQENESIQSSKDKNWFEHLTEFINANIQEPEISIETLAEELNMSRSSFQRKLKGLTGLSPVEFIRLIRLKKAAELLNSGKYRINEVAYMVGFNKPSYFSAMFKKQFGVLPKDFK